MFTAPRFSGPVSRFLLPALLALIGTCPVASAQTPPQLLPYTSKLLAGGGTVALTTGSTCPASGFKSTDAFGDGCLATEIQLVGPRYAAVDVNGNVFFTDYTNGLVRRIDASTGIVTAVAGGPATSPAAGTACGSFTSTDSKGDGCLSTAVHLSHPTALVFSPAGDLYFGDFGYANVRKVAATNGVVTTGGIISLVDGNINATFGYTSNNATTTINAATASYSDAPYGLAFDKSGNLYIADEAKNAVLVVNTNTTGSTTVTGITIPAGTVAKIIGASTTTGATCPNSPATTNGCNFGTFTSGAVANASQTDAPYAVALDGSGNIFFANEFLNSTGKVTPAGTITLYSGTNNSFSGSSLARAQAGSFATGTDFGIASDVAGNVYVTDAYNGVIWRIDGATQSMYVVAGGAKSTCSAATDSFGDGCPATQATVGSAPNTAKGFATAGVFGVTVDASDDLFFGDTVTNVIREIASGTQFGAVGASQPTQTVAIHFAKGDSPASTSPYVLTVGTANFTLGKATCTANSDQTTDCLLPVTATPTALGPFTGTLQVQSTLGATASFALSGIYVNTPQTRTAISATPAGCAGTATFTTSTPVTLTATIASSGSPTGTITFFANGTAIGSPVAVANSVATTTYTFATAGTYNVTATYSGDSYFKTSTSGTAAVLNATTPAFALSSISSQQNSVIAGQTALYSFNVASTYNGSISFACSGLPANSTCAFSTNTVSGTGCSTTQTVALNILTQRSATTTASSLFVAGHGPWAALTMLSGLGLSLLIGLRQRRSALRGGRLWMVLALLLAASGATACNSTVKATPATPPGNYTVTVTANGSAGAASSFNVSLIVN